MVRGWSVDGAVGGVDGAVDGAWMVRGRCVDAYEKNVGGLWVLQNHAVNTAWGVYPRREHAVLTACWAMSPEVLPRACHGHCEVPVPSAGAKCSLVRAKCSEVLAPISCVGVGLLVSNSVVQENP